MQKVLATELKSGLLIEHEGQLWRINKAHHVHVGGRGGAYMQIEVKKISDGNKNSFRLRTDEKVTRPDISNRKVSYLYQEGNSFHFMDEETFEQTELSVDLLDERELLLVPDTVVTLNLYQDQVIGIDWPTSVNLKVTDTTPQPKNSTATASYKPATLETGLIVSVPPFISIGEVIKVSTEHKSYLERA